MTAVCIALGIVSILYFGAIISYAGMASKFHLFWLALGIGFLVAAFLCSYFRKNSIQVPKMIKVTALSVFLAGLAVFALLEVFIITAALHTPAKEADYLIVLGCQVRGDSVSRTLRYRLDTALAYLKENETTKVIVSGGQGPGENLSEAEAMKIWLRDRGIAENRIITEGDSVSTLENIRFSIGKIEEQGDNIQEVTVVVVSNDFHVSRGTGIARKQGITHVEPLAAKSDSLMIPTYYVREALAVAKDIWKGNMAVSYGTSKEE